MAISVKSIPDVKAASSSNQAGFVIKSIPEAASFGPVREAIQGATFGFGDEAEAAIKSMFGSGSYDGNHRAINAARDKYTEEHPGEALAANLAGSFIAPGGLIGKAVSVAATPRKALAVAAGSGLLTGAAAGAGSARPDESRLEGAAAGAALGAVGSTVGSAIGRAGGAGINAVRRKSAASPMPNDKAAAAYLGRLAAGGKTLDDVEGSIMPGTMLAEVSGMPAEGLAGAVVRRTPLAQGKIADVFESRRDARSGDLLRQVQSDVAGGSDVTMSQIAKLSDLGKKRSAPIYEMAFRSAQPIHSERIDELMSLPPFQAAYARAQRIAQLEGQSMPDYAANQPLELRTLDYIKKGLDDLIYGSKRDPQSSIGREELRLIDGLRRNFVEEIDQHAPPSYQRARSVYSNSARVNEAAEAGRDAWKNGPEYVIDFLQDPAVSMSEKEAFRAGAGAGFKEMASKRRDGQELFRTMDSRHMRDVAQALSGDALGGPSAVPALIARQKAQTDFAHRLSGNSATQARAAEDEMLGSSISGAVDMARQVKGGNAVGVLQRLYDTHLAGTDKTRTALSDLMFNPDAASNIDSIRRLRVLEDLLRRQDGVNRAAVGAGVGAGSSTAASGDWRP